MTPQTAAHQPPLSLGFSRQERWSGLPFPSPVHEVKSENEVAQLCLTFSTPWTVAYQARVVNQDLEPSKLQTTKLMLFPLYDSEMGSHSLLLGIFPTQGSSPGLLHWRRVLYRPSHQGSPHDSAVTVGLFSISSIGFHALMKISLSCTVPRWSLSLPS